MLCCWQLGVLCTPGLAVLRVCICGFFGIYRQPVTTGDLLAGATTTLTLSTRKSQTKLLSNWNASAEEYQWGVMMKLPQEKAPCPSWWCFFLSLQDTPCYLWNVLPQSTPDQTISKRGGGWLLVTVPLLLSIITFVNANFIFDGFNRAEHVCWFYRQEAWDACRTRNLSSSLHRPRFGNSGRIRTKEHEFAMNCHHITHESPASAKKEKYQGISSELTEFQIKWQIT